MNRTRRITAGLAAIVIAGTVLAGCASTPAPTIAPFSTTTPTPTPTPTTDPKPASATDAYNAATALIQRYFTLSNEIQNDHPNDTSAIDAVATGGARLMVVQSAQNAAKKSATYEFHMATRFTSLGQEKATIGPVLNQGKVTVKNGQVQVLGCVDDARSYTIQKSNQKRIDAPATKVTTIITAVYNTDDSGWRVIQLNYQKDNPACGK